MMVLRTRINSITARRSNFFSIFIIFFFGLADTSTFAAYNDVTLSSTQVSVGGYNVALTGQVERLVVKQNSFDVVLSPGSSLTLFSPDKKDFSLSVVGNQPFNKSCNTSDSTVTFSSPSSISTTTVVVSGNCGSASVPGQVTNLTASQINNGVNLSWSAPSDGGSPITDYILQYKLQTDLSYIDYVESVSVLTTGSVTGLTNGSPYSFRVITKNSIGNSTPSNVVTAVPGNSSTTPTQPLAVTAVAGNSSAVVSFSTPLFDGGSPITGYSVISIPDNIVTTGLSSPITVTGLPVKSYTFVVTASNLFGASIPSLPSNSVTPSQVVYGGGGGGSYTPPVVSTPTNTVPTTTVPVTSLPVNTNTEVSGKNTETSTPVLVSTPLGVIAPNSSISQFLWKGKQSQDVVVLQKILAKVTLIKEDLGKEYGVYGDKTEEAVKAFQCKKEIICSGSPLTTGWGIIGTKTKNALNETVSILRDEAEAISKTATVNTNQVAGGTTNTNTGISSGSGIVNVEKAPQSTLVKGSKSAEVVKLQRYLIDQGLLKVAKTDVLGLYGLKTEAAVKAYQCSYNIVCSGSAATTGWGKVGPKTLSHIRDMLTE